MLLVIQGVVFAYASVELVGVAAGETENPEKIMPQGDQLDHRGAIGVFYVGSVVLLSLLLPWTAYTPDESPFVTVFANIGVPAARRRDEPRRAHRRAVLASTRACTPPAASCAPWRWPAPRPSSPAG